MGALLKFPPIRGVAPSLDTDAARSVTRTAARIGAGVRYGFYWEKDYICKTPLPAFSMTARHPKTIVIVGQNDSRFIISQAPPFVALRRELAGEEAAICANLAGLFISPRGIRADLWNFCRSLTGWSIRALLNSSQEPSSGFTKCFKVLLSVLRHENHHGRRNGQGVVKA